ncbi:MAG: AAA family ATPase [Pirellulaceae bacterium]|jgi:DNA-binding PadR family transcriptional regulator|nr:AAA family ATPase [Pirellulaceae bacterium]MDP7015542.1 AAA family ATPase [Pirellulaceae bacterium]
MTGDESLLSRLANDSDEKAWAEVEASKPARAAGDAHDDKLAQLLGRLEKVTGKTVRKGDGDAPGDASTDTVHDLQSLRSSPAAVSTEAPTPLDVDDFLPIEPKSFREMDITDSEVEALVLKFLLARGDATGRDVTDQVKLPFVLIEQMLRTLKSDQMVVYRDSAPMNDYVYQLTDLGRERARRLSEHCTYFGSAPVALDDYIASVKAQSLQKQHPNSDDLKNSFSDLLVNQEMLRKLGPAINSGKGMFLYGAPGNGKTSIAKRVTKAFGQFIWVPRALGIDGEVMRLFDPLNHEEAPLESSGGLLQQTKIDQRWVRIRRPTIAVGGELTMEYLEVMLNTATGINEAPLQLKSNCGTLLIDDFGRQRISVDELLNRWIVPLEERVDYLNLASGKTIQVPFDQLIVFSTNLEPRDLVDEAFLRRIPYKIEVIDPTESEFRELFKIMAPIMGMECDPEVLDYTVQKHYLQAERSFRACHPRDLLKQIQDRCSFMGETARMSRDGIDAAVDNYFSVV